MQVLDVAQLAGFLISFTLAMSSVTHIFTRQMYSCIQSKTTSSETLKVPIKFLDEVRFWIQHINAFNGYAIQKPVTYSKVIFL